MAHLLKLDGIITSMHSPEDHLLRRCCGSVDIMSLVVTIVQIVGLAVVVTVLLNRFTTLPFWACFLLALPLILILFLGVLMLLCRVGKGDEK